MLICAHTNFQALQHPPDAAFLHFLKDPRPPSLILCAVARRALVLYADFKSLHFSSLFNLLIHVNVKISFHVSFPFIYFYNPKIPNSASLDSACRSEYLL